ncbi:MAG: FkbM family methyltransferase [Pirellulaceae bacterium]|nr:FkbM family methyltransferase [Pirellulaceae bacterium]
MIALDVVKFVWSHPANRDRRVRAVGTAVAWQAYKRVVRRPWDISVYGDMKMRCYPDCQGGGLMIYTNGMIDYDDGNFAMRYLRAGDAFVDVGANIGVYTLLAASRVGAEGKVLAFEPGKVAFQRLNENVKLNGLTQVKTMFAAVGEQSGEASFLQSANLINRFSLDGEAEKSEMVPCVTLDDMIGDTRYAMGKIDIEGAEPLAFQGAIKSLAVGNPPVWVMELKDRLLQRFDSSADQFASQIRDLGYRLGQYDADANRLSFPDRPWENRDNVVAVHAEAVEQVNNRLADAIS